MKKLLLVVVSLFALGLFLSEPASAALRKKAEAKAKDEVETLLEAHIKAYADRNLEGVMATVWDSPDLICLGGAPGEKIIGAKALREALKKDIEDLKNVTFKKKWLTMSGAPATAWFAAEYEVAGEWKGEKMTIPQAYWSGVAKKIKGKWYIIQSHFSTPVDPTKVK